MSYVERTPLIFSDRLSYGKSIPMWTARSGELPPIFNNLLLEVRRI